MITYTNVEGIICSSCGLAYLAQENKSPGVEREDRCQRCLIAEVAKLAREIKELQDYCTREGL